MCSMCSTGIRILQCTGQCRSLVATLRCMCSTEVGKGQSPTQRGEAHKAKDKSNMKAQKTRWYMCSTEVCILQCNGGACAMLRSTLGSAMLGPESLWRPCGTHVLMKPTFCGTMVSTETLWRLCGTTAPHMDGFA